MRRDGGIEDGLLPERPAPHGRVLSRLVFPGAPGGRRGRSTPRTSTLATISAPARGGRGAGSSLDWRSNLVVRDGVLRGARRHLWRISSRAASKPLRRRCAVHRCASRPGATTPQNRMGIGRPWATISRGQPPRATPPLGRVPLMVQRRATPRVRSNRSRARRRRVRPRSTAAALGRQRALRTRRRAAVRRGRRRAIRSRRTSTSATAPRGRLARGPVSEL